MCVCVKEKERERICVCVCAIDLHVIDISSETDLDALKQLDVSLFFGGPLLLLLMMLLLLMFGVKLVAIKMLCTIYPSTMILVQNLHYFCI